MTNALEEVVRAIYADLRSKHKEFCSCQRCQDDVITHVLNHARPRYVSDVPPLGAAVTRVALSTDGAKTEITVLVYEAMRTVATQPRHISPTT